MGCGASANGTRPPPGSNTDQHLNGNTAPSAGPDKIDKAAGVVPAETTATNLLPVRPAAYVQKNPVVEEKRRGSESGSLLNLAGLKQLGEAGEKSEQYLKEASLEKDILRENNSNAQELLEGLRQARRDSWASVHDAVPAAIVESADGEQEALSEEQQYVELVKEVAWDVVSSAFMEVLSRREEESNYVKDLTKRPTVSHVESGVDFDAVSQEAGRKASERRRSRKSLSGDQFGSERSNYSQYSSSEGQNTNLSSEGNKRPGSREQNV